MRVADYIAKFLADNGVTDMFALTGYGAMYLNDGITKESRIRYYCVRNEATAPMMAEAYARIRQTPCAICVTSGPGAINAIPGLSEAWVDAAPVLLISGQALLAHTSRKAGIPGLRSLGNAEIDIVSAVKSLTKYAKMVEKPNSIRYHLEKALYLATHGRPGPVWLDIPMDVQYAEVDTENLQGFNPPLQPPYKTELKEEIERVYEELKKAKRPLIVAGQGIRQAGAIGEFKRLVETIQAPVILSRLGLDIMPFSHPLNLGLGGIKGQKYCFAVMEEADFILAVGSRLAIPFIGQNLDAFSPAAKVVMVDVETAELKKPGARIDLKVHTDAKLFLEQLLTKLKDKEMPDWSNWLRECQEVKVGNPMVLEEQRRDPIDLYYFMSRLDALSNGRHIFVTDAGSNYYVGGQVFKFEHGEREVTSGTFASMGLGVPLAIGASVSSPESQILAVTGDGSLELNVQELKTMSHYNLNIKLFVINNAGYVSMRKWQDSYFEGRHIGSDEATGIGLLNLQKVAEAFDLQHTTISKWEEIDDKLKEIMSKDGPLFVEVICDSNQRIVEPLKDLPLEKA